MDRGCRYTRRARTTARLLGIVGLALAIASPGRPVAAQGKTHCGEVSSNQTWQPNDNPHTITCDVVVRNSTLTLAPDVQILMNEGTSIVVGAGAAVVAPGNASVRQPVTIVPNARTITPGFWGQLRFEPGAAESVLNDVQLKGGGRDGRPMLEAHSLVRLDLLVFQQAAGIPLAIDADVVGPSLEAAGANPGLRCGEVPGTHPRMAFSRNGTDAIAVVSTDGPDGDVVTTQTWFDLCVPYQFASTLVIGGPEAPSLTLAQRVRLKFAPGAGLVAGLDADRPGQLEASGGNGPGEAVVFTGLEAVPGSWLGLDLTAFTDPAGLGHSLFNTRVEYGGQGGRPMVHVASPDISTLDAVFAHAVGYPVAIVPAAVDGFVGGLGQSPGDPFVDNGIQAIHVLAADAAVDIPAPAFWKHPGVPFDVDGDLLVAGAERAAVWTLDPGVRLVFADGAGVVVGDAAHGAGAIETRGTRGSPVVMTHASAQPGAWRGVTFTAQARSAVLAGLELSYGGAGGRPMLELGPAPGLVTESTFRGAMGHPVSVPLSRIMAVAGEEQLDGLRRNRYEANGVQHVQVRVDGPFAERLATWADPGVPLAFDGDAVIGRAAGASLDLNGGLTLLFPPGNGLTIGGPDIRAAVALKRDSEGARVNLRPLDPEQGFRGLSMSGAVSLDGEGLSIEGIAPGATALSIGGGVAAIGDVRLSGLGGTGIGTGLAVSGSDTRATVTESSVTGFRIGVHTSEGGRLVLERSVVSDNAEWGMRNDDPAICQLATLVYWGHPSGPNDPSDAADGCLNAAWAGGGDKVSDHITWWRYATDTDYTPAPGLGPNPTHVFMPVAWKDFRGR